jgi:hypothetical protein
MYDCIFNSEQARRVTFDLNIFPDTIFKLNIAGYHGDNGDNLSGLNQMAFTIRTPMETIVL